MSNAFDEIRLFHSVHGLSKIVVAGELVSDGGHRRVTENRSASSRRVSDSGREKQAIR